MSPPARRRATHGRLAKIAMAVRAATPAPAPETSLSVLARGVLAGRPREPAGWRIRSRALERTFRLGTWADGLRFVAQVGALAETHDHHPRLALQMEPTGASVRIAWSTHGARNVTEIDVRMAELTDGIATGSITAGSFSASPPGSPHALEDAARVSTESPATAGRVRSRSRGPAPTHGEVLAGLPAPPEAPRETLEDRIRTAYLRVVGAYNKQVRLARLRAELPSESARAVDSALIEMQQRGTTILYPIDDPQARGIEDDAAALWVAGARRDLVLIERPLAPSIQPAPATPTEDLPSFARRVIDAARACTTGRWGDHKVFISHVYRQMRPGIDLGAFKARLVDAQRAGLLVLSRADLVEAMDPVDVRESETAYLGERVHFVRLDDQTRRW